MILTRAKELCVTILYHRLGYDFLATESTVLGGSPGWWPCRMVAHVACVGKDQLGYLLLFMLGVSSTTVF